MWICVGPRDPDTKPSRGRLWVGVRKPRLVLLDFKATRNKVTATPRSYCRGCFWGGGVGRTYFSPVSANNFFWCFFFVISGVFVVFWGVFVLFWCFFLFFARSAILLLGFFFSAVTFFLAGP